MQRGPNGEPSAIDFQTSNFLRLSSGRCANRPETDRNELIVDSSVFEPESGIEPLTYSLRMKPGSALC